MNNDNYIKELEKNSDEMDELKTKLMNLEDALQDTNQNKIKELETELSGLKSSSNREVGELQEKIGEYIDNMKQQEETMSLQASKISGITNDLQECYDKNKQLRDTHIIQSNENTKLIEQLKYENTNLKSQLVELQKIVVKEKTLLQTIEELKSELSKTTKEHQEVVDKLEVQVNDFRERNANLMEHIDVL
jgi:chromosome segregation ATPase